MIKNFVISYGIGIVCYVLTRGITKPVQWYDLGILVICTVLFLFFQWMDKLGSR